jgi:hypothetical protein
VQDEWLVAIRERIAALKAKLPAAHVAFANAVTSSADTYIVTLGEGPLGEGPLGLKIESNNDPYLSARVKEATGASAVSGKIQAHHFLWFVNGTSTVVLTFAETMLAEKRTAAADAHLLDTRARPVRSVVRKRHGRAWVQRGRYGHRGRRGCEGHGSGEGHP